MVAVLGHSVLKDPSKDEIRARKAVRYLIDMGEHEFMFGGRGEFDDLVFNIVNEYKKAFPIKTIYCFETYKMSQRCPRWVHPEKYDECVFLNFFDQTWRTIFFRNCAMIDAADIVLFYVEKREVSGAYKAYAHALKKKKPFINLLD